MSGFNCALFKWSHDSTCLIFVHIVSDYVVFKYSKLIDQELFEVSLFDRRIMSKVIFVYIALGQFVILVQSQHMLILPSPLCPFLSGLFRGLQRLSLTPPGREMLNTVEKPS